jgi:hypothetical protein
LPYVLAFAGYTLILLFDKVIFDTHKLFGSEHAHKHNSVIQKTDDQITNYSSKEKLVGEPENEPENIE